MNRIQKKFEALRARGRKTLIPYIMGGDPDLPTSARLIELFAQSGADFIEVGAPFSDPLADGPVIQAAGVRALEKGFRLEQLWQMIRGVSQKVDIPIILMVYYNMIYRRGVERFLTEMHEAGAAGLIIPDLPPEEAGILPEEARKYDLGLNFLVAPTSGEERIRSATVASTGFVYAVSLKGVTGVRDGLAPELPEFVSRIRRQTEKPVAVGFGISTAAQARTVAGLADGVIVGSAVVKAVAQDPSLQTAVDLVKDLREALDKPV